MQVLISNPSMLLCFQILQLLSFYVATLLRLAGGETSLTQTVTQVRDMASKCFHEQLKNKADKVLRSPPTPPRDLSCPPQITDLIRQLLEIVDANEGSMNPGTNLHTYNRLSAYTTYRDSKLADVLIRSPKT